MPVTQYIGARYVPIIYQNPDDNSNNWKAGVAYEPLTIVSYAGGSYTSKTDVPAGAPNPVDAPQYWVAIGLYSGQTSINTNNISLIQHALADATEAGYTCTSHRNEGDFLWIDGILYKTTAEVNVNDTYTEGINITPITDVIANLDAALAQITSDINDIGGDITSIQGDITSIQGDIATLQHAIEEPFTIMIGDSYAAGWTPDTPNDGWPSYLISKGIRGVASYAGGSAFALSESDARSPKTLLDNVVLPTGVTAADVKRIVVCMGYNDFKGNTTTIADHITSFVTYARGIYTNAIVYIGMCGYAWTQNEDSITGIDVYTTAFTYKKACNNLTECVFMPQTTLCLLGCDGFASDYKHPNETGNRQIAAAIYAAMKGQPFTSRHYLNINCDLAASGISATWYMEFTVTDGVVNGFGKFTTFACDNATAVTMHMINLTPAHFPCLPYNRSVCGVGIYNQDTSSGLAKSFYSCQVLASLGYSNSLMVSIELMNDAGNNFGASKKFSLNDSAANYYSFSVAA